MTHAAKMGYRIARRSRSGNGRAPAIIFGGPHPTVLPEDTLAHCDCVVMNEGEETALELMPALEIGNIEGLACRDGFGQLCLYSQARPDDGDRFPGGTFADPSLARQTRHPVDHGAYQVAFARIDSTKDEELWRLFDEAGIRNVFLASNRSMSRN
jgi:hypothetical protein